MNPIVIAFSGKISSGKTTISQAVAGAPKFKRASFGDYVRKVAQASGLDADNREILQATGKSIISEGWPEFCRNVLAQANWRAGDSIVVDGIRHARAVSELTLITSPLPFCLIHVEVDEQTRESRMRSEAKELLSRIDSHSTENDVQRELPRLANLIVDGTKPIDYLTEKIIDFVSANLSSEQI